jgi:hypothetical protein
MLNARSVGGGLSSFMQSYNQNVVSSMNQGSNQNTNPTQKNMYSYSIPSEAINTVGQCICQSEILTNSNSNKLK